MKRNKIVWQYYPKSDEPPEIMRLVVDVFKTNCIEIESSSRNLASDAVLAQIRKDLVKIGFDVESGKTKSERIYVPVLYGREGKPAKAFNVDAYHRNLGIVMEVEAGRAVTNNQFLKDLFQACMMRNVKYLIVAVRREYRQQEDFETVVTFFDTLYASSRMTLPLEGILIIGY